MCRPDKHYSRFSYYHLLVGLFVCLIKQPIVPFPYLCFQPHHPVVDDDASVSVYVLATVSSSPSAVAGVVVVVLIPTILMAPTSFS